MIVGIGNLFKNRKYLIFFILLSSLFMTGYMYAFEYSAGLNNFFKANSTIYVVTQIIFSLINSILAGLAIVYVIEITKRDHKIQGGSIFSTAIPLLFSVVTSGCYVCGTLLLPVVGITSSIAALPFAGIEIKVLTALLLTYSVRDLNNKYIGACKPLSNKIYRLNFGTGSLSLKVATLQNLRPFALTIFLVLSIFFFAAIAPDEIKADVAKEQYTCSGTHRE